MCIDKYQSDIQEIDNENFTIKFQKEFFDFGFDQFFINAINDTIVHVPSKIMKGVKRMSTEA